MGNPMMAGPDHTHDPRARSWIDSANTPGSDFPIQNLPFGIVRPRGGTERPRVGVAIGEMVLDLRRAMSLGLFGALDSAVQEALGAPVLNPLMALGRGGARACRHAVFALLHEGAAAGPIAAGCLTPMAETELLLPADVGDYTDFYASIHHATNVGTMLRPDQPLLPNYKWVPIGYHGRASSVVASGAGIRRPLGQTRDDAAPGPVFGPSRWLDYECEAALWVGAGNPLGSPVPVAGAEDHLFGVGLLNDWSARDVQRWEYQPLGPFLSKSFDTTVSPWIVTLDALEPFRVPAAARPADDPAPLPYLAADGNRSRGGLAIELEVRLASAAMREQGIAPVRLSRSSVADLYWTAAQLLTHHTSNGCNLRPGDLLGTGTVSGPARENRGCLLELTWRGTEPLSLPTGETRRFLEDGDEVILAGRAERDGFIGIGFGECRGIVLPARDA